MLPPSKNGNGYMYCINLAEDEVEQYMKDGFTLG